MRVCMVTRHSCIRVFKEGYALQQLPGVTVDLITQLQTFGYNIFNSMQVYSDTDMLRRAVAQADKTADVFHVHNEPDWLTAHVRAGTDKPIVYDIHDLESMRWARKPDQDELDSFNMSQAWVHVSDPCRIAAEKYHGNGKPNTTIPSYVNEQFIPSHLGDVSWNSIVYEGGLGVDAEVRGAHGEEGLNFRNYVPFTRAATEQGFNMTLFSTAELSSNDYLSAGGVVISGLPYPIMLAAIRPFAFGLVGSVKKFDIMNAAMPNKLFEYISQGVVPICLNADTAADFCEEYGVGIRLDGMDNLRDQLATGPECRERIKELRQEWTMERNIGAIRELYEAIL